jgi:hypothetical protein
LNNIGDMTLNFSPSNSRLKKAMFGEDDIGSIIRCQFEADRAAIAVLTKLTNGRYKAADDRYLSDRLRLCALFGVDDLLIQPLKTINKHRNAFAHDGTDEITEQQFTDLFRQVSHAYPKVKQIIIEFRGEETVEIALANATVRQKYVLACIMAIALFGLAGATSTA